ncbi:hypothetical protein JOB18_037346 [Solea senegalensis]|uniref:Uncharacterized protein n=1 Tax=Solea senegalensis TaxID=28829 RepID=A0AAV6SGW3_SOLSE|nr:hypothetical protein JOB18_037346 [Solea senegalensis]
MAVFQLGLATVRRVTRDGVVADDPSSLPGIFTYDLTDCLEKNGLEFSGCIEAALLCSFQSVTDGERFTHRVNDVTCTIAGILGE